jgi:MerR family transcriptional regulator, copper efflux regulator
MSRKMVVTSPPVGLRRSGVTIVRTAATGYAACHIPAVTDGTIDRSALRYYEGIGLVEPSTRTGAGYRLYNDNTLARLAFIARAKQLGCSLEEITDLAGIWDGERCGPVQKRFHDLVTTKLTAAERQIAELTALADQLRHAAAQLAGPAVDGPCDEGCACLALDNALAPVALTAKEPAR